MIRRPPRSTLFPTRRSSDLQRAEHAGAVAARARRPGARVLVPVVLQHRARAATDRKSTRLNSSHVKISYAVFCLKKKKKKNTEQKQIKTMSIEAYAA